MGPLGKIFKKVLSIFLLLSAAWVGNAVSGVTITENGNPKAVILLGADPTSIEKHAAKELKKYIEQMSGAELKIMTGIENAVIKVQNVVLIGRAETNPKIKELYDKDVIHLSPEHPGSDGFIIKTITHNPSFSSADKDYLVIGGSVDRGTLYAVYHLLERELNVGFFEDGDRVPEAETIVVNCDIAEKPYFEFRGAMTNGPQSRNAAFWGEKEWKQEIDWLLKKKGNIMQYMGQRWMVNYARERGMRFIVGGCDGRVSADFVRAHPDVSYLTITWPWTATTYSFIDPRDPFFVDYATERVKKQKAKTGGGHFFQVNTWAETPLPGKDPEERLEIRKAFARATTQALVNVDPEAVNVMHGWPFGYTQFYPSEDVKAYINAVVSDLIILDMKADRPDPIHKSHNNFWGAKWVYCVMDGGEHQGIRGNIRALIESVQEIANDPQRKNCVGIYTTSESLRYNFLYYDLLFELAWDPRKIELQSFLKSYASRRYGRESETMLLCVKKLAESAYKFRSLSDFRHAQRLPHPYIPVSARVSSSLLAPLQETIRIALRDKTRQQDNPLYARDLIDMTRLYLDNALNVHIANLEAAFQAKDKETLEREAKAITYYLDSLEKLTSAWPDYRLQTRIDAIRRPQRGGMANDRWIRLGRVTSVSGDLKGYPAAADYDHCDYFELIKFYYRRRIEFYITTLREKLAKGINKVSLDELEPTYRIFLADWVNHPFKVEEKDIFSGTAIEAVVEILKEIEKGKDKFVVSSAKSYQETAPIVITDDGQKTFWQVGGDGKGTISAPVTTDDDAVKKSGASSLKMVVAKGGTYNRWYIEHTYRPPADFSGKELLVFHWYGGNSGGTIYLYMPAPDGDDYFETIFVDDFSGWKRLVFPLNTFKAYGNPSLKLISKLRIRSRTDNLNGTWYLDRVLMDAAPAGGK